MRSGQPSKDFHRFFDISDLAFSLSLSILVIQSDHETRLEDLWVVSL